jgi:hypothetical protein
MWEKAVWPNLRDYPAFDWMDWGNSRKYLDRNDGFQAEIWTQDIPYTKQEC